MKLNFIFLIITICKSEINILEDDWSIEFKGRDDFYDILEKKTSIIVIHQPLPT